MKTANIVKSYDLIPNDSHKSFYGKARVFVLDDGTEILRSYETDILARDPDGTLRRLWHGSWIASLGRRIEWSATTGRHIKAFAGIGRAEFLALP